MIKSKTKLLSVLIVLVFLVSSLSACKDKSKGSDDNGTPTPTQAATAAPTQGADDTPTPTTPPATDAPTPTPVPNVPTETQTLVWGTHWVPELDPYNKDETTGEYTMGEATRQATIAALDKVREILNVEVQFIQYSQDVRSELISSVLAGNPVCDIALMWGGSEGTILAQNILQPLDDFADKFSAPEDSWMLYSQLYGHYYLFSGKQAFIPRWPLCYNITMIEKVDTLKDAGGKTIYPMDLFLDGNWTFSTFKDYLQKISTYYANVAAPDSCVYDTIQAYETDLRFAGLSAMYASGGGIYRDGSLQVDNERSLKGTAFIEDLRTQKLMTDPGFYDPGFVPEWLRGCNDFRDGGTVFTDCADWIIGSAATNASDRGEAIGIVPYPRPDDMDINDPAYQQVLTVGDSLGILKGVSKEKTELCLEFIKLFYKTYYEVYGQVDNVLDYKAKMSTARASDFGFDIFNEEYGDKLLETFIYVAEHTISNDYADLMGIRVPWDDIWGKSLTGVDGYASYNVSIKANIDLIAKTINEMETILAGDAIRDNIAPAISRVATPILPKGTDPASIDWSLFFGATDAVDGVLDVSTAEMDTGNTDFGTAGSYNQGAKIVIYDKSGNRANWDNVVIIYDPDNTEKPTITVADEFPNIAIDTDTSSIAWKDNFIASAVDRDGLDVSQNIRVDLSELDTTTPGTYPVVITVTDYAGNEGEVEIEVTVGN